MEVRAPKKERLIIRQKKKRQTDRQENVEEEKVWV
jgi:hypothetical protein